MTFGFDRHAGLRVGSAHGTLEGSSFKLDSRFQVELRMPGMHHATNAAAVFGVARWFGLEPADIIAGLRSFTAPAGRTTLLNIGGVKLIDDTYNANPASMAAAIETLSGEASGRRLMVMGDMLELGAETAPLHRRVVGLAFDAGIEILVAVGPAMIDAVRVLAGKAGPTQLVMCANAEAASDILVSLLSEGDACWVKGSRLMELDRVVSYVKAHWGVRAAVA
jgi:UDP-N-acetylmuramoyl-tripeptide--D-alanyl-D-alanine ligase